MVKRLYAPSQRRRDYEQIFESEAGKRILADMVRYAHILHPTYVKGDSHQTAFREGERNMVLRILSIIGQKPEQFIENVNDVKEYKYD